MSALRDAMLAASPWGLWPLDETSGTTAHNAVSGGVDGTYGSSCVLASVTLPDGTLVYKPSTDGTNQNNITFPGADLSTMPHGDSPYTLVAVSRSVNNSNDQGLIALGTAGTDNAWTGLQTWGDGHIVNTWWGGMTLTTTIGPDAALLYSDPAVGDGIRTNMFVATYDGTTRIIYLNGSEIARDTPGTAHAATTDTLLFGATDNDTGPLPFGGLGYVGIYGHAVAATTVARWYLLLWELTTLHDLLTPLGGDVFPLQDATGAATSVSLDATRTLTLTGTAVETHAAGPKAGLSSWQFDGNGYLVPDSSAGLPVGGTAYTLFGMVNVNYDGQSGIVGYGGTSGTGTGNYLRVDNATSETASWSGADLGNGVPLRFDADRWYLVATTYDGTTRTIYQNNTPLNSDTPAAGTWASANLEVARVYADDGNRAHGSMCYAGVLPVALSYTRLSHLAALMLADTTAPTAAVAGVTTGTTRSSGTATGSAGTVAPRVVQLVDVYRNGSATAQVGAYVRARLPTVAPTALYRTTSGVVLRPVSDVEITDSLGNYRLPLIPPGDIIPTGQPYIVEFSRKADFSVVDVVVETTSFGYMAGDHPLADVLPTDSIGTRVLVTVDLRDCSGTALVGQLVSVRPLGDSVLTATGALIGSRDAAASTTVDSNARASFLLYPSAALNPAQVYSLTSSATNQVLFFTVPDAGGVVTAHLTEAVAAGFISVTAAEVQSAGTAAVQHTSPTSVQEDVENLRYLQNQAPRGQIGYAAITAPLTTTSTTLTDAAGLTVSVTATTRALKVTAYTGSLGSTGGAAELVLYDVTAAVEVQRALVGSDGGPVSVQAIATPGAGSRSYKVQYRGVSAGTTTLDAGTATPAYLLVEEV